MEWVVGVICFLSGLLIGAAGVHTSHSRRLTQLEDENKRSTDSVAAEAVRSTAAIAAAQNAAVLKALALLETKR